MSKRLTDLAIRNLKPGPARREIPAGDGGLMLVLQPSGARSRPCPSTQVILVSPLENKTA